MGDLWGVSDEYKCSPICKVRQLEKQLLIESEGGQYPESKMINEQYLLQRKTVGSFHTDFHTGQCSL